MQPGEPLQPLLLSLPSNRSQDGAGYAAADRKSLTMPVSRNRAGLLHARLQQLGSLENAHTFNSSELLKSPHRPRKKKKIRSTSHLELGINQLALVISKLRESESALLAQRVG